MRAMRLGSLLRVHLYRTPGKAGAFCYLGLPGGPEHLVATSFVAILVKSGYIQVIKIAENGEIFYAAAG